MKDLKNLTKPPKHSFNTIFYLAKLGEFCIMKKTKPLKTLPSQNSMLFPLLSSFFLSSPLFPSPPNSQTEPNIINKYIKYRSQN